MSIFHRRRKIVSLADRGPLRVMFLLTDMPVGGAETLLVNLIRRLDRDRFAPELCCLKSLGPLGEELSREIPAFCNLLSGKYDLRVLPRLTKLFRERRIDAVVTVGAGDKMFWGRLAAWRAGVPVVLSALHSTGWPDGVGRLNRLLTSLTDGFIAVAEPHGQYLRDREQFPADKVFVIPNGIDLSRFRPRGEQSELKRSIGLSPEAPLVGIVAALRPEKNHELFLQAAAKIRRDIPNAHFLVVGDGPRRADLETLSDSLGLRDRIHFLGTRADIPELVALLDVFLLTSHNEANPVSILEALACETPVVATRVGSVPETVRDDETGYLITPGNADQAAERVTALLREPTWARQLGKQGRELVAECSSLERMVAGYEDLMTEIYERKQTPGAPLCRIERAAEELLETSGKG